MKKVSRYFALPMVLVLALALSAGVALASVHDFGGQTIIFASYYGHGAFADGAGLAHLEEIEEIFNVNIEFKNVHWSETADTVRTSVLAGDIPYHAAIWQNHWKFQWDLFDFIHTFDDVVDAAFFDRFPQVGLTGADQQAGIHGLTYSINMPGIPPMRRILWNKDLFDREGLPSPYDLMDAGQWTWDAFRDIALQATRDTTGDGQTDQWGYAGANLIHHGIGLTFTNNAPAVVVEDGRMVFNGTSPEFLETLHFWRGLVADGVTYPEWGVHEGQGVWQEGNAAMFSYYSFGHGLTDIADDFGVVPMPVGPSGDYAAPAGLINSIVIPITVDDPMPVLELFLALYELADPWLDVQEYEEDFWMNFATTSGIRDFESLETIQFMTSIAVPDFSVHMTPGDFHQAIRDVVAGEKTPATAMEEVADVVQAHLDDRYN